jgi:hypothetical protein
MPATGPLHAVPQYSSAMVYSAGHIVTVVAVVITIIIIINHLYAGCLELYT